MTAEETARSKHFADLHPAHPALPSHYLRHPPLPDRLELGVILQSRMQVTSP